MVAEIEVGVAPLRMVSMHKSPRGDAGFELIMQFYGELIKDDNKRFV